MYSYSSTFIYSLLRGQVITTVLYFIILCFAQYEIEIYLVLFHLINTHRNDVFKQQKISFCILQSITDCPVVSGSIERIFTKHRCI
nr:MAG TPA: hypothetical protein [Bacteriophage sp.]